MFVPMTHATLKKTFLFVAVVFFCGGSLLAQWPFGAHIKRVLFLGNSITYSGEYISNLEAWFVENYPAHQIEFVNAGLPSETVSGLSEEGHAGGRFPRPDLHERLQRVLKAVKPDMVFACYGINDGIYQPLAPDRFAAFRSGMDWLHQSLVKAGVKRIVHITPFVYDDEKTRTKGYNDVMAAYSQWLVAQHKKRGWEVVDLHAAMTKALETGIAADRNFRYAKDQVHPGSEGHWFTSRLLLAYLHQKVPADIHQTLLSTEKNEKIVALVARRQTMMKDAWLGATGHKRPEMPVGLPLAEALDKYKQIAAEIKCLQEK